MTVVSEIVTAALQDLLASGGETPTAADAATGLRVLNQMLFAWQPAGVNVLHTAFALNDTFVFWVPPRDIDGDTIDAVAYQGTWDATANTPALVSATGTQGYVYKVATAGTTTLDDVSSWAVNDYLVYDGVEWLKGRSSAMFEQAIVAMLGVRLSTSFSVPASKEMAMVAESGWRTMQASYVIAADTVFDPALVSTPSRRYFSGGILQ